MAKWVCIYGCKIRISDATYLKSVLPISVRLRYFLWASSHFWYLFCLRFRLIELTIQEAWWNVVADSSLKGGLIYLMDIPFLDFEYKEVYLIYGNFWRISWIFESNTILYLLVNINNVFLWQSITNYLAIV